MIELRESAIAIATEIEEHYEDGTLEEYIDHRTQDVEYTLNKDMQLLGVSLLIQYGGPTTCINTRNHEIVSHYGSEEVKIPFNEDASDYIQEMFSYDF